MPEHAQVCLGTRADLTGYVEERSRNELMSVYFPVNLARDDLNRNPSLRFPVYTALEHRSSAFGSIGSHISNRVPPQFHSMLAGAGAGLVASIVTCPLDVVKTRLQAQALARNAKDYEGVKATVSRILKQSGVRGLYRGLGPTILGYLPTWGIYFTVYDEVKLYFGAKNADGSGGESANNCQY